MDADETLTLSIGISIILIVLYLAALFFKLVTHRGVYNHDGENSEENHEEPEWGKSKAFTVLILATIAVGLLPVTYYLKKDKLLTVYEFFEAAAINSCLFV